ncbi:MAG: BMC domain-containing protein [Bacilli bacterium]|nr:BMC domain-containing protein [Bacilli bacterium]
MEALGMLELLSIAKGIEAGDAIVKTAKVKLIHAIASCPGKYTVLIKGQVAAVKSAIEVGAKTAGKTMVNHIIIPNVDEQVFGALTQSSDVVIGDSVGVVEAYSLATAVLVADAAVKAARVSILEIRLGRGLGGKAFVVLSGDVANVTAAVKAAVDANGEEGMIAHTAVVPRIDKDMLKTLL